MRCQQIVALYQNPLDGDRRLGRREPGNIHISAKNQRESTCVRDSGALLEIGRFQNLYMEQVTRADGEAFRLRTAARHATEQE